MLEKKFKNVEVILPNKNLGYAKGFNLAFRQCKNNFVLTFTPDVIINKNLISFMQVLQIYNYSNPNKNKTN